MKALPGLDMDFLSPRWCGYCNSYVPHLPTSRNQGWASLWHLEVDYNAPLSSHTWRNFFSVIAFPTYSAYARIKIFPFQNALFTVMVSHTPLLPTKELISQQMKFAFPMSKEFTGLTTNFITQKQLARYNGWMDFQRFSENPSWEPTLWRCGALFHDVHLTTTWSKYNSVRIKAQTW